MQKSFIERIFPHSSSSSVLPRYQDESSSRASTSKSPPRIQLRVSSSSPRSSESDAASRQSLQAAPLSASIIHHDDPFLHVERAAKALQRTIQSYLDAQSDGLNASLTGDGGDDLSSVGSPTPTPSIATPSKSASMPRTIPVRQPAPQKISLRGARRGLSKAMDEFAHLKTEELAVITSELTSRQTALKKSKRFQAKRNTLLADIHSIQGSASETNAQTLRKEADNVKHEMQDLETRLFELRSRYRQLTTQADQLDNSLDSKLSSYKSSLALIEKDMKQFLRQPPVTHSLPIFDQSAPSQGGMYALKPDRRTLEMAEEQWTAEQKLLSHRRADVEGEQEALQEGVKIWQAATTRIADFEKSLRRALRAPKDPTTSQPPSDYHDALLTQLDTLISSLKSDLSTAESKSWNLLICCLGAEIEALEHGRFLLGGRPPDTDPQPTNGTQGDDTSRQSSAEGQPPDDLLNGRLDSPGAASNTSLRDTLEAFGDGNPKSDLDVDNDRQHESGVDKGKGKARAVEDAVDRSDDVFETPPAHKYSDVDAQARPQGKTTVRDESEGEDDDPGPDFLLSHS